MGLKEELEAYRDEFLTALKAKDFDKVMGMYTDDCLVAHPGHEFLKKSELRPFLEKVADYKIGDQDLVGKVIDVTPIGSDWAVGRGMIERKCEKDGHDIKLWSLVVVKKEGGQWKVHSRAMGPTTCPPGMGGK